MDLSVVKKMVEENSEYIISMRRRFHQYPELSGKEYETRKIILSELESMGIPFRLVKGTGVIAIIRGAMGGKTRVIRADMDGLQIAEDPSNLTGAKICVSQNRGISHTCGHDAHMAMLLGTIRILWAMKEELCGTILCCFEEGEETNCGVEAMLEALQEYDVAECFALHVYNALDSGKINLAPGPRMAGNIHIGIQVKGKAGHSSRPDQAANPIIAASHMITQMNSAFLNQIDAEETVTVGICVLRAGTTENVIPDSAYIGGTGRYFKIEEGERAVQIIRTVAENTALCHKCTVAFEPGVYVCLHPVINDADVAGRVRNGLTQMCGGEVQEECTPWFASECYCKYLDRYPGALGLLGIRNEELGCGAAHHNGKFDIDESALALGVCAEVAFALS